MMKLMTNELENEFKKIGRQDGVNDPIIVAKFFNPVGDGIPPQRSSVFRVCFHFW